jgi:iron complex transport system permease protein
VKPQHKTGRTLLILAAVLLILFLLSFRMGRYGVSTAETCRILLDRLLELLSKIPGVPELGLRQTWDNSMAAVVLNVRLPRIVMACLVGCCLSAAGAAYQGVFQNPMASPDVLGASSGAAFGAALGILLGFGNSGVTAAAFAASLVTVVIVYLIGQRAPGGKVLNLVLAGMIVSALFNAGTSYIKLVADPNNQLPEITYWLMGSLNGTVGKEVLTILPVMALGLIPLFLLRWKLNLLALGDDEARAMGIQPGRLRLAAVVCATLVTAASISVSGMIGWVGLVMPHLCRKLVGSNFKVLLPASMLAGAAFLLLVDDISRNLMAVEIPIGILTAVIGAPFFLYLLLRKEEGA